MVVHVIVQRRQTFAFRMPAPVVVVRKQCTAPLRTQERRAFFPNAGIDPFVETVEWMVPVGPVGTRKSALSPELLPCRDDGQILSLPCLIPRYDKPAFVHERNQRHARFIPVRTARIRIHMIQETLRMRSPVGKRRFIHADMRLVERCWHRSIALDPDIPPFHRTRHVKIRSDIEPLFDGFRHKVIELFSVLVRFEPCSVVVMETDRVVAAPDKPLHDHVGILV